MVMMQELLIEQQTSLVIGCSSCLIICFYQKLNHIFDVPDQVLVRKK